MGDLNKLDNLKAAAREGKWPTVWTEKKALDLLAKLATPDSIIELFQKLEAAQQRIAELNDKWAQSEIDHCDTMNRAQTAEAELARRDSSAGEPVYQMRLLDGEENESEWIEVTAQEYNTPTTEKYGKWERRTLFTAAQPSALPPIGEIRLSEYDDNGVRTAIVHCLHDQADWDNFQHGTKLFLATPPAPRAEDVWIKCSDRMPVIGSTVIVHMNHPIHSSTDYAIATYDKYGFSLAKVTYWMPLPAAPGCE